VVTLAGKDQAPWKKKGGVERGNLVFLTRIGGGKAGAKGFLVKGGGERWGGEERGSEER